MLNYEAKIMTTKDIIKNEIQKLTYIWNQTHDKEAFIKQVNFLTTFVKEEDIFDQIDKLLKLASDEDFGRNFQNQLNNLIDFLEKKEIRFIPVNDVFKDEYDAKQLNGGISFLCPELDKRTGGIQNGTICTIAGAPGSMKTTYAINLCYNAIKQGKNVCYLSLEETPLQIYSKLLSRASLDNGTPLPTSEITRSCLSDNDKDTLFDKVYPYLENQIGTFYILGERDFYSYGQAEIENKLKEVDELIKQKSKDKQNEENHGIDIVVVDHIQLLKYASSVKDEYRVINEYVSFFRRQSQSFLRTKREIVIILLSQVNREGIAYSKREKHDGMYLTQHVAEASEVERSSAYIITVYTDAMVQVTKQLKIGVLKLRGSQLPTSTITVYADGKYYQVGDTSIPEQLDYSDNIELNEENQLEQSNLLNDLFSSGILDPL